MPQLKTSNQFITQSLDAGFEICRILCLPVGATLAWHRLVSCKANIQDILGIMTIVATQVLVWKAELAKRQRGFSGRRPSICITPDSVELRRISINDPERARYGECNSTYYLVTANHGHDTQRLHAFGLGIEGWAASLIAKNHIRM